MKIEFTDGQMIDTSQGKEMTMDGKKYMIFPLVLEHFANKTTKVGTKTSLEDFFNVEQPIETKKRKVVRNSIAYKVREWLESGLKPGDTTNFHAPTGYAIRVAAEGLNKNISIRRIRKNVFNVVYNKPQVYARSKNRV